MVLISACSSGKKTDNVLKNEKFQENISDKGNETEVKDITINEIFSKIDNKENFNVIVITKDCKNCETVLKEFENVKGVYKIDFSKLSDEDIEKFSIKFPNINSFPSVLKFISGELFS